MSYEPTSVELKILTFIAQASNGRTKSELWRKFTGRSDVSKAVQSLKAAMLIKRINHRDAIPLEHYVITEAGRKFL